MSRWKAPPSISQQMPIRLGTDVDIDKLVQWCGERRLTAGKEIGSRTAYGVFEDIGEEESGED